MCGTGIRMELCKTTIMIISLFHDWQVLTELIERNNILILIDMTDYSAMSGIGILNENKNNIGLLYDFQIYIYV